MTKTKTSITLTAQIKWVIGYRIILCLALLSFAVLITSAYDIFSSFQQIKKNLDNQSSSLSEFIIAQSLIDNDKGISTKLDELNQANEGENFQWILNKKIQKKSEMKWIFPMSWVYTYPVHDEQGLIYGDIRVSGSYLFDNSILLQLITKFCLLLFFSIMIFILLYPLSNRIPQNLFINPIINLLSLLKHRTNIAEQNPLALPLELQELQTKIIELIDEITKKTREIALGQLATQVAHDIRSPLTALDVVVKDILAIPEEQRILIRNATSRIHDIANNLLSHYKNKQISIVDNKSKHSPELLSDLITSVISEKRAQYKDRTINITANINDAAYSAFANVSASEFKRVLSNLLNNAIEATTGKSNEEVIVSLSTQSNDIVLTIQDNGCGIAAEILDKINARETVTQKEQGHGLGLPYAISMVEELWGGQISIQSQVDVGTIINLILPKMPTPNWFVPKLVLSPASTIIILDDDETIHQVWLNRFKEVSSLISVKQFYSPKDLVAWHKTITSGSYIYLIDYELIGNNETGLDIIEHLKIAAHSYLVTSRYEELIVRERCEKLRLSLIPKSFAPHVPINIIAEKATTPDLIFIDDNETLTAAWKFRGATTGKNVMTFNSIDDFRATLIHYYNRTMPVYIDSDLKDSIAGQDFAKELFNKGFTNIYLATGFPAINFVEMSWIKAIVGKEPPF